MSIDVSDEIQEMINHAMKTGLYRTPEDVVSAALRSLAEDWDDLSAIKERAHEPGTSLAQVEAQLLKDDHLG